MYSSENVNRCKPNDIIDLSDKLNCTQLFNSGDRNCTVSNNDMVCLIIFTTVFKKYLDTFDFRNTNKI